MNRVRFICVLLSFAGVLSACGGGGQVSRKLKARPVFLRRRRWMAGFPRSQALGLVNLRMVQPRNGLPILNSNFL